VSFGQPQVHHIKGRDRAIGLFIILAFIGVTFGLTQRGMTLWEQRSRIELHTDLQNSYGLEPGMPIDLAGMHVGHVQSVMLKNAQLVRLSLSVDQKYAELLTPDSYLQVSNLLGFSQILGGVSLEIRPGTQPGLLLDGSEIQAIEPVSIDQLVARLRLQEMSDKTASLLAESTGLIQDLRSQNAALSKATENFSRFSVQAVEFGSSMEAVGQDLRRSATRLDQTLITFERDTMAILTELEGLARQGNGIAAEIADMVASLGPVVERLPGLVRSGQQTMGSADQLVDRISGHWLLGGGQQRYRNPSLVWTHDPDLYQEE